MRDCLTDWLTETHLNWWVALVVSCCCCCPGTCGWCKYCSFIVAEEAIGRIAKTIIAIKYSANNLHIRAVAQNTKGELNIANALRNCLDRGWGGSERFICHSSAPLGSPTPAAPVAMIDGGEFSWSAAISLSAIVNNLQGKCYTVLLISLLHLFCLCLRPVKNDRVYRPLHYQ